MSHVSPTPDEQFELTSQLAALASANVPLAGGLRALSQELPRGRTSRRIDRLATHLERGVPLDQAAAAPDVRLPKHLVGMLACGLRGNNLGEVLQQFLKHEQMREDMRRGLWLAFAYPLILAVSVAAWLWFLAKFLMPDIAAVFHDFEIELPASTRSMLEIGEHASTILAVVVGLVALMILFIQLSGRSRIAADLVSMIPLIGPLWRYSGVAESTDLLQLFLRNNTPLPQAFELTAAGSSDGVMAAACREAGRNATLGLTLAECVARTPAFPATLTPVLSWGDRCQAPAEALGVASEWFRARCRLHGDLLSVVIPPLTFVTVMTLVLGMLAALFQPLLYLIRSLSYYSYSANAPPPDISLSGGLTALALGVAILAAGRIAYGPTGTSDATQPLLRTIGWIVSTIGGFTLLIAIGSGMGLVMWIVTLLVAAMIARQIAVTRRRAHLALVALAVDKQIPLPECVEAFATECGGRFARRATKFADRLRAGMPLADAIAASPRVLPPFAQLSARIGMASNRLGPALRHDMISQSSYEPLRRTLSARVLYLAVAFAVMPLIVSFMLLKIVPAFIKIFDDFEVEFPSITVAMMSLANSAPVQLLSILIVPGCVLVLLLGAAWYVGLPMSWLPGARRLARRMDRAIIERSLAFPAEQGQPLPPMLDVLASYYPVRSVAKRIKQATFRLTRGEDWRSGFRSQSLLSDVDVAVLSAAERAGNLPWALREMADSNERRLLYRLELLVQFGSVAMVLLVALIVAFVAVALMLPLVKLIWSLT